MKRIAIGGFQHETNTFSPFETGWAEFEMADGWPALAEGPGLFDAVAGINIPIAGFIERARGAVELVPTLWCSAEPGGLVTADAFERIAGRICRLLGGAGALDGVYLDLHGAMVVAGIGDGEGELLARVRKVVGPDIPIVASLDYHANISPLMIDRATALTIYRTYPHVDMAETGARAADVLLRQVFGGGSLFKAWRQGEYLTPLHLQATLFEPNASLYAALGKSAGEGVSADIALGFPPADVPECGPAVVAYAGTQDRAEDLADRLATALAAAEGEYRDNLLSPDAAIATALANRDPRPVVLADTQDNSGAGGTADDTTAISDLLRHGARGAVVAIVTDGAFAAEAHRAGTGNSFDGVLGRKRGTTRANALRARFKVLAVGSGEFVCTGPVANGARMNLGPMALVSVENETGATVKVVVSSVRSQPLDQAMLRHVGIEPAEQRIIVLKSSVHFRADFDKLAAETLVVEWPGCNPADPRRSHYTALRRNLRLFPNGPLFAG